ncbi:hypothetical protein BDZ91DRAFT_393220 [Kalaharituber pfeilii]|nr:hypothetical protein BDZ91DRAFT_393220 [Kalaharituber pfeilii]
MEDATRSIHHIPILVSQIQREMEQKEQFNTAPANNIVKTPQVPTPDSAFRHPSGSGGAAHYFNSSPPNVDTEVISHSPPGATPSPISPKIPTQGVPPETGMLLMEIKRKELEKKQKEVRLLENKAPVPPPESIPKDEKGMLPEEDIPELEVPQLKIQKIESPVKPISAIPPALSRSLSQLSIASSNYSAVSDKETWDKTLARVVKGIVSIKATTTRPFDTEAAGDYTATGFVISKIHGLILSNRHVVSPAPITAVAVFINYEEVPIYPIYRDPIHDFGVFRYDPEKLKHIDVEEIELRPDLARVGEDIKVVGNDAGEKLSILGSTLARLDRHAPSYGSDSYNDFNTFYMQAASGTSGGSSGSPVLNIHGQAVALNAGGSNSSQSSFYLPLNRVVRAVELIKKGKFVTRGTIQTEFLHQSYDELRRLGLKEDVENECRSRDPTATGLLSVTRVLRGGPASTDRAAVTEGKIPLKQTLPEGTVRIAGLEPGDILMSCNGKPIVDFIGLWDIIDDSVGKDIVLGIYRQGGDLMECVVTVDDLHRITPYRFLEIGGAIIHDLSYQMARSHNVKLGSGVFCAASGFLLWSSWSRDFLITSVDGKPTRTLNEFIEVIREIPDYARVPIMSRYVGNIEDQMMLVDVDRHFFLASLYERDDEHGTWNKKELGPPPEKKTEEPKKAEKDDGAASEAEDEDEDEEEKAIEKLRSSMVSVVSRLPYSIFGHTSASNYSGVGLIVSLDPIPLVLFDRNSVPSEMLDIRLTLCNNNIPGKVVHLSDFTLVTFDKSLLPKNLSIAVPEWDEKPLRVRDEVKIIGLTSDQTITTKDTAISSIGTNFSTWQCNPPRQRLINVENINVLETSSCWGGCLVRRKKNEKVKSFKVAAYWMAVSSQDKSGNDSFWTQGLDITKYVMPVVKRINEEMGKGPVERRRRDLGIEFADVSLATVSAMGLSQNRFDSYVKAAKKYRGNPRPLIVETRLRPAFMDEALQPDPNKGLKIADIVLEIDGKFIDRIGQLKELDLASKETVDVVVLRDRQEVKLAVPTVEAYPTSGTEIVQFFGAIMHGAHAAALEQVAPNARAVPVDKQGIYVGGVSYGSPALENIRPTHWILEVDETPVGSIKELLKVVEEKKWEQGRYIRIKQVNRKGITSVVSVKVDDRFWPCMSWTKDPETGKWIQKRHTGDSFVRGQL